MYNARHPHIPEPREVSGDVKRISTLQSDCTYKKTLLRAELPRNNIFMSSNKMILTHADNRQARDLTPLLRGLDLRADRILHHLYVINDMDRQYALLEQGMGQQDYIDVIRSHTEKMVTDLEVIGSKTQSLDDEQLLTWIVDGADLAEKRSKQVVVMSLMEKIEGLQKQMAEAGKVCVYWAKALEENWKAPGLGKDEYRRMKCSGFVLMDTFRLRQCWNPP